MKHFWMTAAVGALCAFAVQAWAAPQTELLELVATKHHHLRGAQAAEHAGKTHKHAKSSKASGKASKSKRAHRGAKSRQEEAVRSRHGGSLRSRRAEARAAREEAARPRHEAGGRSRRHAVVISDIKSDKARSVRVGRRDTLAGIARKTGVSVEALARLNRLHKPYHVHSGAYLKLPTRRYYIVKSGDTLYSLSRRFGVDAEDLSAFNSVGLGKPIRSGQKLYLPDEAADANARAEPEPETVERPARRTSRTPSFAPIPYTPLPTIPQPSNEAPSSSAPNTTQPVPPQQGFGPENGGPAVQLFQMVPDRPRTPSYQTPAPSGGRPAIIQTSPPPTAAEVVAAGRGKFAWPADGTLISVFGPTPNGQRNDGVNILAPVGEAVRAAADGQVVYAGDQVPSFGNLVLVKHDGGWVTAYAHMSKILVRNRDQVVQGQQLGEVGQTGSVDRPQLHFEIRYAASAKDKATPVDPGLLLPQH